MATYTYAGNYNRNDGTTELQVASGLVPLGSNGDFTVSELAVLSQNHKLIPGIVQPDVQAGVYQLPGRTTNDPFSFQIPGVISFQGRAGIVELLDSDLPDTIMRNFPPGSIVSANGTLAIGVLTPVDASGGNVTMTLPSGGQKGQMIAVVKWDGSSHTVAVSGALYNGTGTLTMYLTKESIVLECDSSGFWWPIAGHQTIASLDARYGGSSAVASVFGRTGAVTANSGDYSAAEVTNAADLSSSSLQTFTGPIEALDLIVAGLTGATAASRYVGATVTGAPTTGAFLKGDFIVAQDGAAWICTAAGSPGTWAKVGAFSGSAAGGDLSGTYPNPGVAQTSAAIFTAAGQIQSVSTIFARQSTANQVAVGHDGVAVAAGPAISFGASEDTVIARAAAGILVAKSSTVTTGLTQTGWVSKSANYPMANTDSGAVVTASCIITLPAAPYVNFRYSVKVLGAGVTATVSTGTSGKIDNGGPINSTSMQFSNNGQSYDYAVAPNGTDWIIV